MTPHHPTLMRSALVMAALALPLLLAACAEESAAGAEGGFVFRIPVTWTPVSQAEVVETVELVGDVYSRRWAEMAFERPGRVTSVSVDIGDEVSEGQELARLDDSVLLQRLAVARAQRDVAAADRSFAEREAVRATEAGLDVLSASEQDRRSSAATIARARHAEREASVAGIEAELAQLVLLAPFDAVVVSRNVTLGSYANAGVTAFTLVDMEHREVRLELPPSVATGLDVGARVSLRSDELPGLVIDTQLDELVPAADFATRTFVGVVRLNGLDLERGLKPGMFVRALFEKTRVQGETVVPADAILIGESGPYIVVMDDPAGGASQGGGAAAPIARIVPVRVLAYNRGQAAVAPLQSGALPPDTRVVVAGADNAFPGAPLAPVALSTLGAEGAGDGAHAASSAKGAP